MNYILVIICFFLFGCQCQTDEQLVGGLEKNKPAIYKTQNIYFDTRNNSNQVATIIIDSCEYLYVWFGEGNGGGSFTHKGNCKFCIERLKNK